MNRIIKLKNIDIVNHTYCGINIDSESEYTIQTEKERELLSIDAKVNQHIWSNPVLLVINDGEKDLSAIDGDRLIKGHLPDKVLVQEETIGQETGGHFQSRTISIDVSASIGWQEKEISFPIPIAILSGACCTPNNCEGDKIEFLISPNTVIGAISSDVAMGDTIINVSQTVIDNIQIGFWIDITDGSNLNDLGRVIAIDKENLTITVENASSNIFQAISPTYVRQTIKMCPEFRLVPSSRFVIGESKIGASYLPANTIIKLKYYNSTTNSKTFSLMLEYLY